jgi:hypothetical protein
LSKAQSLFLGRTGTPTSVATSTTFTNDIFVKGTIRAGMGVNGTLTTPATSKQTAFGVGALGVHTCNTAGATAFGFNALKACATSFGTSLANTAFGANTLASIENQGYSCAFGVNSLITATGAANTAIGANSGYAIVAGANNVFIGADNEANSHNNKISSGNRNVFVGNTPTAATIGTSNSTILGHACTITGNNAVAIGYQASAGANEISLGTPTETVLCKGTTANGSLVATADIFVNGVRVGKGTGTNSTVLGNGAVASVANATAIGQGASATIGTSTAIGSAAQASANGATAIGYGAVSNGTSQIVLGRATETVYCVGTAANTSLIATSNITVNGCSVGQQPTINAGTGNTVLGVNVGAGMNGSAINNTFIGNNAGNDITSGYQNTFVGSNSGLVNDTTTGFGNTFIGNGIICSGTSVQNSTALGNASSVASFQGCCVLGAGATATANNQVVLGTANETVICKGTGTSITASGAISAAGAITTTSVGGMSARVYNLDEYNATANTPYIGALLQQGAIGSLRIYNDKAGGTTPVATELYISTMTAAKASVDSMVIKSTDIQMKLPITLQTTYASAPSSAQLGYSVTIGGGSTNVPTGTATSICGITPIPVGVWIINYTSTLTSAAAASFNGFQMGISTTTGFGGLINPSGFQISAATESFSGADTSVKSGSFTYTNATGSSATLYVIVQLAILTGTFTGVASAYLTRIG